MANVPKNSFHTYFIIESHPTSLGNNVELILDMKHKAAQPLTKILEKEFKLADGIQDYIISVYSGDIIISFLKDNEIMLNNYRNKIFQVRLALRVDKNKFELKLNTYIEFDYFYPCVKFEPIKKLMGKSIEPPTQLGLTPFNFISLFSEALSINLKKQPNDQTMLEFIKFSTEILKTFQKIPFKLFLLIYIKAVHSKKSGLISSILELFFLGKIEKPKTQAEIIIYKEPLMSIFQNQTQYLEVIKTSFHNKLMKFYLIFIYYFYMLNDIKAIEEIMIELRDNNNYDKLILAKMFLEDSNFYRNINTSKELKNSLIEKLLEASDSYDNLLTSFSLISEYIDADINQILSLVVNYYPKIFKICKNFCNVIKLDDYIKPKTTDNLEKLQENLDNLRKKLSSNELKTITIKLDIWKLYLDMETNQQFLEFLSSYLIKISKKFFELKEVLNFISKYLKKDMDKMMKLFIKNYDKLESICKKEKRFITASDFLEPKLMDDLDDIKKNLDIIVSKRILTNIETINFPDKIWLFYINEEFKKEDLFYIEQKLLKQASCYENIIDCIKFASALRQKKFINLLRFININFEKIYSIIKLNDAHIDFSNFFEINEKEDNIEDIHRLIIQLVNLENDFNYRAFDFPLKIWKVYSNIQNLEHLRVIRKIIKKLKEVEPNMNEDYIDLPRKIHDAGYLYIGEGKLNGEQLVEFLSKEEAYYNEKLIKEIIDSNNEEEKQLNTNISKIKRLEEQYNLLAEKTTAYEKELQELKSDNYNLGTKAINLGNDINNLLKKVTNYESEISTLRTRFNK